MAKAGSTLIALFQSFTNGGVLPSSRNPGDVQLQGSNVGVSINANGGNVNSLVSSMTQMGLQVTATDATHGIVEGFLPIAQLLAAAQNSQVLSMSPLLLPSRK